MPDQPPPMTIETPSGKLTITPGVRALAFKVTSSDGSMGITSPDDARKVIATVAAWLDTQSTTAAPRSVGG